MLLLGQRQRPTVHCYAKLSLVAVGLQVRERIGAVTRRRRAARRFHSEFSCHAPDRSPPFRCGLNPSALRFTRRHRRRLGLRAARATRALPLDGKTAELLRAGRMGIEPHGSPRRRVLSRTQPPSRSANSRTHRTRRDGTSNRYPNPRPRNRTATTVTTQSKKRWARRTSALGPFQEACVFRPPVPRGRVTFSKNLPRPLLGKEGRKKVERSLQKQR